MKKKKMSPIIAAALAASLLVAAGPVGAIPVFDPENYAQNLLQAARSLEQINHQVQSLQNEAAMLQNMAKNLRRIDFPQLGQMNATLQKISRLMGQAEGIGFDTDALDRQFSSLFPAARAAGSGSAAAARARLDAAMAAFRQEMTVQAQVAENAREDAAMLAELASASSASEGSLQAQQATNQLLALAAKQQIQIQGLMAASFRGTALEQARRGQAEAEGREATRRFLGARHAYTPQ